MNARNYTTYDSLIQLENQSATHHYRTVTDHTSALMQGTLHYHSQFPYTTRTRTRLRTQP